MSTQNKQTNRHIQRYIETERHLESGGLGGARDVQTYGNRLINIDTETQALRQKGEY